MSILFRRCSEETGNLRVMREYKMFTELKARGACTSRSHTQIQMNTKRVPPVTTFTEAKCSKMPRKAETRTNTTTISTGAAKDQEIDTWEIEQ
ncbi:hypothetical protein NDU88_006773 [Pleurodeles waltl]|uniref:Uncharacterized protein n=1 Tax=Pleurodeles waltl TaxID=8319 RepID=A0AAV7LQ24_PLEWA|nr:hypothetical protein NDU88_006773 [Pleurodeles waltl]